MAAASRNGPLAPHMRPCAPCQWVKWMGDNPPSKRIYFWGGVEGVYGPQIAPLFRQQWCITTTSEWYEGHCQRPIGMPGMRREKNRKWMQYILIKKNYINKLKRLQMCVECVPTHRILYIRIRYIFRISATWHWVRSLVQHRNLVYDTGYLLTSLNLIESAICFWWIRSKIILSALMYLTVCLHSH